jgi:tRNA threonylcarbamoyladenosine biosynthesis protein TsaB
MALILSIETSARSCSVALHDQGQLIKTLEISEGQAHASKLAVLIQQILSTSGREMQQLKAVAVSAGPGSYTGLRIGVSTAKGLCFGLSIPLISIPTLKALAYWFRATNSGIAYFCPMIDAKRMEVYCEVFDADMNVLRPVESIEQIDNTTFAELLNRGKMLFLGDGAAKYKDVISHPNALFLNDAYAKAEYLGELAFQKFSKNEFEDLVAYTPFYLKEFIAKRASSLL